MAGISLAAFGDRGFQLERFAEKVKRCGRLTLEKVWILGVGILLVSQSQYMYIYIYIYIFMYIYIYIYVYIYIYIYIE